MSSEVKRYDAVHLRYEDCNIRYGEGCEVEVVTASDYAALEAENARLRQQLADVFEGNTKLHVLWTETVRQRDKLAQALGNVEREHELFRRMKNCEIQRGRGSFGIAVMSDPPALEWQALDKELQQLIDDRRAALAAELAAIKGQEHAAEQPDTVGAPRKLLAEAERIIDSYAEALKECHAPGGDWTGEEAAQDDYEHEAGVASELRAILAIAQIQERNT